MSENLVTLGASPAESPSSDISSNTHGETVTSQGNNSNSSRNTNRNTNHPKYTQTTTPRDYEGATPKIGGVLALRSKNMTKKRTMTAFARNLKYTS